MKKLLSVILSASIALSGMSVYAQSVEPNEISEKAIQKTIDEPTPEMMEEMIKRVRPLIDVPEHYGQFNWDFRGSSGYSQPTWYFSWYGDNGEIDLECDSEGRIVSYYVYDYSKERKAVLPSVSPDELLPVARAFIEKTASHLSGIDLRLEDTSAGSVFYSHSYTYSFMRYENGVPVPDNTVSISVDYTTKQVVSFYSNINLDVDFESFDGAMDAEKAKQLLSTTQDMTLSYRLKTEHDDDGNTISRKAYLIYRPSLSYVSVNAVTGEIYTERNTWEATEAPTNSAMGSVMMDSATSEESAEMVKGLASGKYQLTEQELEQLAVLESLITKDEATKTVLENSDLYIADNAYLSDARLSKRYDDAMPLSDGGEKREKYVWNLYFSTPGEDSLGMSAVVDAQNGELISYNASMPYAYHYENYGIEIPELKYTQEDVIKIAEEFIKKQQPEKAENVVYSSCNGYAVLKYVEDDGGNSLPVYRADRINFVRQNDGVNFTYNSFNMGVDRATGKITRYSYTWYDDVEFEPVSNIISSKDALMSLYSYDGFGINYEINRKFTYVDGIKNSVNTYVYSRPVYSAFAMGTTTIRAADGKMINYNGDEILQDAYSGEYSDIDGHWAEATIKRFSWLGFGPDGERFEPGKEISGEEFISLCESFRIYGNSSEILSLANLSRMDAVKLIIDYLGYGKIAKLENVFITDFADNSDFAPEDIGYAAIARGFGLIEGDGENFRPSDILTRAEAYTLIENITELGMLDN